MKKFRRFAEVAEVCRFAVVVVEIVFTVVVEVEVEVAAEVFCIVSSRVESNGELQIGYIYIIYLFIDIQYHSITCIQSIHSFVMFFSCSIIFAIFKRLKNCLAC